MESSAAKNKVKKNQSGSIKKLYLLLFTLILVILLFSGCWDWEELNGITIVSGIGLDETEEPGTIRLTAQVIRPAALGGGGNTEGTGGAGGGGGEAQAVRVLTTTGETIFQALRNLSTQASHRLFLSHTHVIVVSRKAAEEGIYNFIDFFSRDPEPRPNIRLLIAEKEARDILRHPSGVESIPALGIYRAVQTAAANAFAPDITIQDTNKRLASETTELVAPLTKLYEEEGIGNKKKTRVDIAGTAVFRGDKMVGTLNRKETRGLHWILDEVETGIIVIEHAGGKESLEIVKAESKMTPEIKNNELVVKINLDVNTYFGDQQCEKNLTDPTEIALLEKKLAAEVRTEITGVVKKAQELKADIFGFGDEFHRKYPEQWKKLEPRWKELFPGIKIELEIKSGIRETGAIREPVYQLR
jgi:spore germination protein KC